MTAAKPLIGVTTSLELADEEGWVGQYALVPEEYLLAVAAAGGVPMLLPPQEFDDATIDRVLGAVDALVLSGGVDVDPAIYGAERDPHTEPSRPQRDAWERTLVLAALERDMPVLAICRGVQLLDVALGGSLHQHLPALTTVSHGQRAERLRAHRRDDRRRDAARRDPAVDPSRSRSAATITRRSTAWRTGSWSPPERRRDRGGRRVRPRTGSPSGCSGIPEQDTDLRLLEALVAAAS